MRFAAGLSLVVLIVGCGQPERARPAAARCPDLDLDRLGGSFALLQGGTIQPKFRLRVEPGGRLLWVGGDGEAIALTTERTGEATSVLRGPEATPRRRIDLRLTEDCHLGLTPGWEQAGAFRPDPAGEGSWAPLPGAERYDFEPCTERAVFGAWAQDESTAAGAPGPDPLPVVTEPAHEIAAWGAVGELPAGCQAVAAAWVDGQHEADAPQEASGGPRHRWAVRVENRFLGRHHVAVHREVRCGAQTRLLGVACTDYEVR